MAKIRIYELAKELVQDNKTLERAVRDLGIEIKSYMSTLTPEQALRVRASVGEGPPGAAAPKPRAAAPKPRRAAPKPASASAKAPRAATGGAERPRQAPIRRKAAGPRPSEKVALEDEESVEETASSASTSGARRGAPVARRGAEGGTGSAGDGQAEGDEPAHAVGARIALPKGTRRFEGGLANRLEREDVIRVAAGHAQRLTAKPAPEERGRQRPVAPPVEAQVAAPVEVAPVAQAVAEPAAPVSTGDEAGAAVAAAPAAAAPAAVVAETPPRRPGHDKVLRDENGVIIGVRQKKAGPNIRGFIKIEPRRKAQVILTEANKAKTDGRASKRKKREEKVQQMQRRRNMSQRQKRRDRRSGPKDVSTVAMGADKKRIRVNEVISVSDLAHQMSVKAPVVIKTLWKMGMRGTVINSTLDVETAEMVAGEFGYVVENVTFQQIDLLQEADQRVGELRAPVVTIMGHVDHGKTTLLDYIRSARVAAGEAGGITQHTSAYRVETKAGPVVFVDTPGHQAFSNMRQRGASFTDIVVLIVAADDGVMPTTVEAIKHANKSGVPIVVVLNKVDKPEANVGRVKQMLMEHNLIGEEFGGETSICEISALTGQGVDHLLELLGLQAELLDLRAPDDGRAQGVVIEARVDKGRGSVATLLVQQGSLQRGDIIVAGETYGKVRNVFSTLGETLKLAGPSMPVDVQGLSGAPSAGERFYCVETEKDAKAVVAHRYEQRRRKESVKGGPTRVLERLREKRTPTLKIVVRADVQGSAEALKHTLEELATPKVRVEVIFAGVGAISENDVKLAHAGGAVIVGFNVKPVGKAAQVALSEGVKIHSYDVIYKAADEVLEMMVDQLEPERVERPMGEAEVRALFAIPRLGLVCGSRVLKGTITRSSFIRVKRNGRVLHDAKISSLRVFKDDVKEVKDGHECGIVVDGFESA